MNWELIVSSTITIIGFIVTYFMTKRNLKDEIQKNKISISLEKMEEIPFDVMNLLTDIQSGRLDVIAYSELLSRIYSYCSFSAISIATKMQALNYQNDRNKDTLTDIERFRILTLLSLLITQIKYDLTGEIVNPELWFVMKINDYHISGIQKDIRKLINDDIRELKLNKRFMITDK